MWRCWLTLERMESPIVAIGATSEAGNAAVLPRAAAQVEGTFPLIR